MLLLRELWRRRGRIRDDDLVMVQESEDARTAIRRMAPTAPLNRSARMTVAIFLGSLLGAMALGIPSRFRCWCGVALMWHLTCSTRRSWRRT